MKNTGKKSQDEQEKNPKKPGQSRVGTASDPGRFGDIGIEEPSP